MRNSNKSKGKAPTQSKSVPAASADTKSRNKRKRVDAQKETKGAKTAATGPGKGKGKITAREKGVADFWLSAMKINVVLSNKITKLDEGAFKYLKDIKTRNLEKDMGFILEFVFYPNPYFKNSSLEKTYYLRSHDREITRPYLSGKKNTSRPLLNKTTGTKIKWHQNMNLKRTLVMKRLADIKSGNAKGLPDSPPQYKRAETFFNFFNPQTFRLIEDDAIMQMEERDHVDNEEAKEKMEEELNLGLSFRDRIIPHFTSWFTGKAAKGHEFEVIDETFQDNDDAVEEEEDEDEFRYVEYLSEGYETEFSDEDSDTANNKYRYEPFNLAY